MTPEQQIRLEALKLAIPRDLANPDAAKVIERAKAYEAFVAGAGHAKAPAQQPVQQPPHKPGHTGNNNQYRQQR